MTKVLVVDDDLNIQRVLVFALKQEGYEVMVAADGGVFNFGNQFFGSLGATTLANPIVSIAPSYNTVGQPNGYWMLDAGGLIYAFGAAWAP